MQPAEPAAPARILLAAVPYAFKSVDSDTLAGREASDYVTREDLQSAVAAGVQTAGQINPITSPGPVTESGTSGYVPLWTGAATLGNSPISEYKGNVGIGTVAPVYPLDVNGAENVRGLFKLEPNGATSSASRTASSTERLKTPGREPTSRCTPSPGQRNEG